MKKNLWMLAMAAFAMTACTSEDVPTAQVTENDWVSPDGQVLVQLSAEGLPEPTVSLGRAAITGTNIVSLDDLGIFALGRGATSYNANTNNEILLKNVIAKGTEVTTLDQELHTTIDEQGNTVPLKRIRLYESEENKNAGKASIYYYPIKPDYNYDFYGYYPRQTEVTYGTDVEVTFEATDGSMDIITGKQVENAPTMQPGSLFMNEATENNTNTEPIDGYNSKYIRSIKYHNWLIDEGKQTGKEKQRFVPNIKFEHRTALLNFFIVANDKQAGAPDTDLPDEDEAYNDQYKATKLRVFDLYMLNVNTKAKWSVISNEITWATPQDLEVCKFEENEGDATVWESKDINIVDADGNLTYTRPGVLTMIPAENKNVAKQAGYMLVEPKEDGYQIKLSVLAPSTDNTANGKIIPEWQQTTLSIPTKLEAGHSYNVYIQLNALQEVNIHAELVGWIEEEDDIDIPVE